MFGGMQQALLEADVLYGCGRAIVEAQDVDEILNALADYIAVPGLDRMAIWLFRPSIPEAEIEVASVWRGGSDGPTPSSAPGMRRGDRWTMDKLPALDGCGATAPEQTKMAAPRSAAPLVIDDVRRYERLDEQSRETISVEMGLTSALIVPLLTGGQVIGWLLVGASEQRHTFTARQVRMVQGLADQAAPVLRSFELLSLATRRAEREQSISAMGDNIRRYTEIEAILRTSVRELGRALSASEGVIWLHPGRSVSPDGVRESVGAVARPEGARPADGNATQVAVEDGDA
jgi:GAF domain-containing protein